MLSQPVGFQWLKAVAGWNAQIVQHAGLIQQTKFPERNVLDIWRQSLAASPRPDQFCLGIGEALDHATL